MKPPKNKTGRPPKKNEQRIAKAVQLLREGKDEKEVAKIIGVNPSTIWRWKEWDVDFCMSVNEAKEEVDQIVEAKTFHRAIGYTHKEEKVFCYDGEIIRADTTKHYPPDTQAAIFWLKNRRPKEWRDKIEHDIYARAVKEAEQLNDEQLETEVRKLLEAADTKSK